ncbi:MAG: S8 family serine peptidase, partial [Bacillota bacterium]|nr:S8 family serine peptidase [Bacillota bacterium]
MKNLLQLIYNIIITRWKGSNRKAVMAIAWILVLCIIGGVGLVNGVYLESDGNSATEEAEATLPSNNSIDSEGGMDAPDLDRLQAISPSSTKSNEGGTYLQQRLDRTMISPVDEKAAGKEYQKGEVLLLFNQGVSAHLAGEAMARMSLEVKPNDLEEALKRSELLLAKITGDKSVNEVLDQAKDEECLAYAQANFTYSTLEGEANEEFAEEQLPVEQSSGEQSSDEPTTEEETSEDEGFDNPEDRTEPESTTLESPLQNLETRTDDPDISKQWLLDTVGAYRAWEKVKTNGTVSVAVIDTGIDIDHEDLKDNLILGYNSYIKSDKLEDCDDTNGHGTHVAGIISGVANNGVGISGVSYNANLIAIKASKGSSENFSTAAVYRAYSYLLEDKDKNGRADLVENQNLHVINMSLGGIYNSMPGDNILLASIDQAQEQNILSVCAAGNGEIAGTKNQGETKVTFPADYETCMSVIALSKRSDGTLYRASYSNYGDKKDISAPGTTIYSTITGGGYGNKSGTSMATPVVSGCAALAFAKAPSFSPEKIKRLLEVSATRLGDDGFSEDAGWGCVNIGNAIDLIDYYNGDYEGDDPTGNMSLCAAGQHQWQEKILTPATADRDGKAIMACENCLEELSNLKISRPKTVRISSTRLTYNGKSQLPKISICDGAGAKISTKYYNMVSAESGSSKDVGRHYVEGDIYGKYRAKYTAAYDIIPKGTSLGKLK